MTATDTTTTDTELDLESQVGAYAERLFETGLAALEGATIMLGRELGLYGHLDAAPGSTAADLADRAGVHPRYAREWLEQQAAAGLIDVSTASEDPGQRRYRLPVAAAECLLRPESLASVGPLFDLLPSVGRVYPALVDAFRTGGGVPYAAYAIHDAQGDFNRPAFTQLLTTEWIPAIPDLAARLAAGPARIAEIGCGEGWAAISIAKAWPNVEVDGFDNDEASIAAARKHAAEAGVGDRVRFEVADVTGGLTGRGAGTYDAVLAFEMVHDLARPVDALATMRRLGTSEAVHLVMDERAAEAFEPHTENPIERLLYAASVLHCLPVGMVEDGSAGTGTVMRPDVLRSYATTAGFTSVEILPIEHDMFRFYRLGG
jgi:2-polyprenyl-3-methyl-5-hydroxy-6-metoxy-1,4-benzoquinol methylase